LGKKFGGEKMFGKERDRIVRGVDSKWYQKGKIGAPTGKVGDAKKQKRESMKHGPNG